MENHPEILKNSEESLGDWQHHVPTGPRHVLSGDAAAVDTEAPGLVGEAALGFTRKLEVLAAGETTRIG